MTALRLAQACGRFNVDEMLDEMTAQQFEEWLLFDAAEGLGDSKLMHLISLGFSLLLKSWGNEVEWWQLLGIDEPEERAMTGTEIRQVLMRAGGRQWQRSET